MKAAPIQGFSASRTMPQTSRRSKARPAPHLGSPSTLLRVATGGAVPAPVLIINEQFMWEKKKTHL